MATIERKSNGYYLAKWFTRQGKRKSEMTTTRNLERAVEQANHMEAVDRFWEDADDGVFSFYAELGFSPDYCHRCFTHKGHIRVAEFRKLLREAQIQFKRPGLWRDRKKPRARSQKRYMFKGRLLTVEEALQVSGSGISVQTARARMNRGMDIEDAVAP